MFPAYQLKSPVNNFQVPISAQAAVPSGSGKANIAGEPASPCSWEDHGRLSGAGGHQVQLESPHPRRTGWQCHVLSPILKTRQTPPVFHLQQVRTHKCQTLNLRAATPSSLILSKIIKLGCNISDLHASRRFKKIRTTMHWKKTPRQVRYVFKQSTCSLKIKSTPISY